MNKKCLLNYWSPAPFSVFCCFDEGSSLSVSSLALFTGLDAPFSSCSSSLSNLVFLPWNCTFPLADPVWAALFPFPFPLNLWPFDFYLFRDSCWSSIIFFNASFSTSPSSTSQVTSLFLNCRLPLFASFALSSASLAFSLNRIIPYTKDRKQRPGNFTEHQEVIKKLEVTNSTSYL